LQHGRALIVVGQRALPPSQLLVAASERLAANVQDLLAHVICHAATGAHHMCVINAVDSCQRDSSAAAADMECVRRLQAIGASLVAQVHQVLIGRSHGCEYRVAVAHEELELGHVLRQ
jgi:hypothetical protein